MDREVDKMKKSYVLSSAIALSLALAACGSTANNTDKVVDEPITEESNQGTSKWNGWSNGFICYRPCGRKLRNSYWTRRERGCN